jgi:polyhydroxyalkanoate synthase
MAGEVVSENQIATGRVQIRDKVAELDSIQSALLAFAGETDNLVPPEVAERSVEIVASNDKEFRVAPGGHMGVIIGSKAQSEVWSQSADWLEERSQAKPVRAKRKPVLKTKAAAKNKAKVRPKLKARAARK